MVGSAGLDSELTLQTANQHIATLMIGHHRGRPAIKMTIFRRSRYGAAASVGGTIFMIGLKRFIRQGFVFSVVGHVGLLLGLLFVGAGGVRSVPPEAPWRHHRSCSMRPCHRKCRL